MAINNIINDSWQGHTHGEVEDALKVLLSQMLEDIASAGIPDGGITIEMLASALRTKITNAVSAIQVNGTSKVPSNGIVSLDPYYTKTQVDGMFSDVDDELAGLATVAFSGSYNDLTGKPEIPTQAQLESMIEAALEDVDLDDYYTKDEVEGLIPTSTSDLTNDSGFLTAQDVSGMVAATGDLTIVENEHYIDITIQETSLSAKINGSEVSSLTFFSDPSQQTSLSLTVSGSHLKADITAALSGTGASSFVVTGSPITQSGGTASGTITVAYTGATTSGTSADATLTLTSGDVSKAITLHYSYASGPYISVSPSTLSFKAATGETETKSVTVNGSQLTADVTVAAGGAFQVSLSSGSGFANSVTVTKASALAGATIYVKYTAGSSATTGTLTLSSTGATNKSVTLTGAVSTITTSVDSLSLSTVEGTPTTGTFTVNGSGLDDDIEIEVSGTGFSVSPAAITPSGGSASGTVTVTYSPSAAGSHSGSVTVKSGNITKTVTLSGTATAIPAGDYITDGLVFQLDGLVKGSASGKWVDRIAGREWTNHGATELSDSFSFDGVDDYFEGSDSGIYTDDNYTIEVVFDSTTSGSTYFVFVDAEGRMIMCYVPDFQNKEWFLSKSAAAAKNNPNPYGAIVVNGTGGSGKKIVSITTAATGVNGGVLNGVAKSTNICEYSCDTIGRIGCRRRNNANDFFFSGKVYAIRIYNRRLSTSEMIANQKEDNTRFNLGLTIE